ncbi:tRNA(Met) cytidine acetyltransferase [Marinobacter vulgaris]|uniref:tRNA(Met) cytidine acetyltransferase TmcA n=1 Tax=Marinobacter vulgaris TaxID=1928331 RepID=A0A2V3ZPA4_9GAMM|nr:GNAT family N-acetyltransferase [Marinobacter vulgaris]PXX93318.1 tRNA(Met) cytidine acetyltransferase [Marinobacter vulgaris]TSJ72670.1 tRNA(Met) cytidine acetyltransferase [Marinobacter vulgaris]
MDRTGNDTSELSRWLNLQSDLRAVGHRRLVILEGDRDASVKWLCSLLPGLSITPGVWTGPVDDQPESSLTPVTPVEGRRWLGQELACVVWDGWQGNPPDSFAALSGTLSAGGLFFWLMPPLQHWRSFADPDYRRTGLDGALEHPFAARLAGIVAGDSDVIRVNPAVNPQPDLPAVARPLRAFEVGATEDQQALVNDAVRTGLGRRRRPLVVTADRGRGKSAALGMAAVRLLAEGRRRVVVTAPDPAAVNTLFHHARLAAGQVSEPEMGTDDVVVANGGRLEYRALDRLLAEQPEAEVVMVDEAAAVPAHLLKRILLGWPRVVFATTVHGYEGSGRGFAIRFRSVLDRETPHWQSASLAAPIRWSATDPLEPLTRQMFLLDAEAPAAVGHGSGFVVEAWNPATASDQELYEAFGLLVDAHYRTSPGDLRQWMDDPAAVSWRLTCDGVLAGVLWATVEGGLDAELAEQVMMGKRRMRGHLLPQSLATHSGFAEAASQRLLRVVRIAVSAGVRGRGLGQRLVAAARDHAASHRLDGVGTSFGGNVGLVAFWQRCGLATVRLGLKREASSGEYPLQMLSGVSDRGRALANHLRCRLAEHWLTLVPLNWPDLETGLTLQLTDCLPTVGAISDDDRRDLNSFARGYRGFDLTLPVLRKLSQQTGVIDWVVASGQASLWARAVIQGWTWSRLQSAGECRGREPGEAALRGQVRAILQNQPDL